MRILIVEDETIARRELAENLRYNFDNATVRVARSSTEALRKFEAHSFDIVLLDLKLGRGKDGIELLGEMRKIRSSFRSIAITAYAEELGFEAAKGGFDKLVRKKGLNVSGFDDHVERKLWLPDILEDLRQKIRNQFSDLQSEIGTSEKHLNAQMPNLKKIRTLFTEGFTADELRRFCYDEPDFRPIYDKLAQDSGKATIIDLLIEYSDQKLLIDILLDLAKQHNPARYEKHQPYYLPFDDKKNTKAD